MIEQIRTKLNFGHGTTVLLIIVLSASFINQVAFGLYNFPFPEPNPAYQDFWNMWILHSTWSDFLHQPWSILSYGLMENSYLMLLADVFWMLLLGYSIEHVSTAFRPLSLFIASSLFTAIVLYTTGDFMAQNIAVHGPRLMLVTLASYLIWQAGASRWQLREDFGIPYYLLASIYLVFSLIDQMLRYSSVAILAYVAAVFFAWACAKFGFIQKNILIPIERIRFHES